MDSLYLIALGSNQRHHLYGSPRAVVRCAMEELAGMGTVQARSAIIRTDPIGPAQRRFANAACVLESALEPLELLGALKDMERHFGRRSAQRWGDRVIDLDIILWSGGAYSAPALTIPHPDMRARDFVLMPAAQVAADWRDPVTGLCVKHLLARLEKSR